MLNFGAAVVCIFMGLVINWRGRRGTMLITMIPFTAGWMLLVFAQNVIMLIIGRTLIGIGCGSVCVACPVSSNFKEHFFIRNSLTRDIVVAGLRW
jgi:MFS family permease